MAKDSKKNLWMGYGFILVGLIPVFMAGIATRNWQRAQNWTPVEATVLDVDLITSSSSGPHGRSSSTTLNAEYEYDWEGTVIQSDGIAPFDSIEPFRSYKKSIAAELRTAKSRHKTVSCYVNPGSPDQAYLKRDFRIGAILIVPTVGIVFCVVGFFVVRERWKKDR